MTRARVAALVTSLLPLTATGCLEARTGAVTGASDVATDTGPPGGGEEDTARAHAPDAAPAPDVAAAPRLGQIGDPCDAPEACASHTHPAASLPPTACAHPQVWPGGYCVGFCTLPDDPFTPPRLARADCPVGAVCLPRVDAHRFDAEGLAATSYRVGGCFAACERDADCRDDGYYCRRDFAPRRGGDFAPVTFENGYCAPQHCKSRGCLASYACDC